MAKRQRGRSEKRDRLVDGGRPFLVEGRINTVGAGPDFDVRLTSNFKPGKFGQIDFKDGIASLKVEAASSAER